MSCDVMSCHVSLCHVMSCHVILCHVMPCHVMSWGVLSYCVVPYTKVVPVFLSVPFCDGNLPGHISRFRMTLVFFGVFLHFWLVILVKQNIIALIISQKVRPGFSWPSRVELHLHTTNSTEMYCHFHWTGVWCKKASQFERCQVYSPSHVKHWFNLHWFLLLWP